MEPSTATRYWEFWVLWEGVPPTCTWTACQGTSQHQIPTREDQCPALGWGFGGSGSRNFSAGSLVKVTSAADVRRATSFTGDWRHSRAYTFHGPRKTFKAWSQLYWLQITGSSKSRLIQTSEIQHYIILKEGFLKMSLHLKTIFRLNVFTLHTFLHVLDDGLEIVDYKFGLLFEA